MMNKAKKWLTSIAAVVLLSAYQVCGATDIQQLVHDTQRSAQSGGQLSMVWWIPQEFWRVSLSNNPNVTEESRNQLLGALEDYQVFVLVRAKTSVVGLTEVQSKEDLLSHSQFLLDGRTIDPIPADKLTPGAQTVLASLKPALAGMLGPMGQAMQIIVYPSKRDGVRITDPNIAGGFQYALYDQSFTWRLPIASLLANKIDPKTHDEFPGDYLYNPYTGTKLIAKPSSEVSK